MDMGIDLFVSPATCHGGGTNVSIFRRWRRQR